MPSSSLAWLNKRGPLWIALLLVSLPSDHCSWGETSTVQIRTSWLNDPSVSCLCSSDQVQSPNMTKNLCDAPLHYTLSLFPSKYHLGTSLANYMDPDPSLPLNLITLPSEAPFSDPPWWTRMDPSSLSVRTTFFWRPSLTSRSGWVQLVDIDLVRPIPFKLTFIMFYHNYLFLTSRL